MQSEKAWMLFQVSEASLRKEQAWMLATVVGKSAYPNKKLEGCKAFNMRVMEEDAIHHSSDQLQTDHNVRF